MVRRGLGFRFVPSRTVVIERVSDRLAEARTHLALGRAIQAIEGFHDACRYGQVPDEEFPRIEADLIAHKGLIAYVFDDNDLDASSVRSNDHRSYLSPFEKLLDVIAMINGVKAARVLSAEFLVERKSHLSEIAAAHLLDIFQGDVYLLMTRGVANLRLGFPEDAEEYLAQAYRLALHIPRFPSTQLTEIEKLIGTALRRNISARKAAEDELTSRLTNLASGRQAEAICIEMAAKQNLFKLLRNQCLREIKQGVFVRPIRACRALISEMERLAKTEPRFYEYAEAAESLLVEMLSVFYLKLKNRTPFTAEESDLLLDLSNEGRYTYPPYIS